MFKHYSTNDLIWLGIGLTGQTLFAMRFLIQWIVSEYRRKSVIPDVFWYFSLTGGVVLLSYAIFKRDPVFIIGQSTGLLIYLRNIYFIKKERKISPSSEVVNPTN